MRRQVNKNYPIWRWERKQRLGKWSHLQRPLGYYWVIPYMSSMNSKKGKDIEGEENVWKTNDQIEWKI